MNRQAIVAASVVIGLVLVTGSGLAWWKYRQITTPPPPMPEFGESVQVVKASLAPYQPEAELVGTVFPFKTVTLSNEVAGTIKEIGFDSGMIVEEGQVLLRLDASTEEADLKAAQANISVAEAGIAVADAQIKWSESTLRRLTQALATKAAAEADVERAQADLDVARAQKQRATADVEQAKARAIQIEAQIAKKTMHAPFRAKAGLRNVHVGQYIGEGEQIVGLLGITKEIYLDFGLPQDQAQRVKVGDVFMVRSSVLGDEPERVEVVAIDAAANPSTRNVRLRAVVENKGQKLSPGMFVDVRVPIGPVEQVVVVPLTAVRRASYGDHVFVVREVPDEKDSSKKSLRSFQVFIKTGTTLGDKIIVLDGLKEGDQIAGNGSFKLREGALIIPGNGAPPPGGPGAAPAKPAGEEKPGEHK